MAENTMFPACWWKLPKEQYDEARGALKSLAGKDLEPGTKDVSSVQFH